MKLIMIGKKIPLSDLEKFAEIEFKNVKIKDDQLFSDKGSAKILLEENQCFGLESKNYKVLKIFGKHYKGIIERRGHWYEI